MTNAVQAVIAKQLTLRAIPVLSSVGQVDHLLIPGPGGDLLVRVYTPKGDGPFPVLVYFHGGGWVIGTLDTYDASCRALTDEAACVVVSVAYRLAPEHPFPAAAEDAYAAYEWVLTHAAAINGDPQRIAVGGES
ncbi:MAG: alpha/beta hydrolase fold domain-containing protein, partial [Ardenticatenales bacterium]|nr:alpha/beta hydrolase fold domain-containing protein [Ardenticatenales bacterium]